jgi:hypothetical protein
MLRKALFVLILAVQFFAVTAITPAHEPIPDCFPCQVR